MFKNALVSVSDKTGLIEFLQPFLKQGLRVVSTGGTADYLRKNGVAVVDVSEQTGFPEVMDGRVKTLHPHVHMGLLAKMDNVQHVETLKKFKIDNFDLVIVNLYPFEAAVQQQASFAELIEKIDVGGPSMLRAAAKNFSTITVICDPRDYSLIQQKSGPLDIEERRKLAAKVFAHTSVYDSLIATELGVGPEIFPFGGRQIQPLRYGENPQQWASWYLNPGEVNGLQTAKILQGKELSFNNILDLDAAASLVREFDAPAVVAVKHNNPCGVGIDASLTGALKKALSADPVSVFGGIIALNREVTAEQAELLTNLFLECVVAPGYTEDAVNIFTKKKNLRILDWPGLNTYFKKYDVRSVSGGFIVQTPDQIGSDVMSWQYHGEVAKDEIKQNLIFAEKVCASLKSNAIAIVQDGQTIGLGMGQVNRVEAVEHAIKRMHQHHKELRIPVLASDAFFPFPDSIELIARAGIRWVLQPGGSVKDEEVKAAAQSFGINLVMTGQRHFRH